ncbi:MAG: DUF393 domain-containing protein [Halobacteriovoraceae bacterium]|nr:DUF393 domain-containing protein [Halobacteriovoraceae bacterium]
MKDKIFLFDEQCALCLRFVKLLNILETYSEFSFISLHEDWVYEKFPDLNKEQCREELHIIDKDQIYRGEKAIEFLISLNPKVKKHLWLLENGMSKKAIQSFYQAVNKLRKSGVCKGCGH